MFNKKGMLHSVVKMVCFGLLTVFFLQVLPAADVEAYAPVLHYGSTSKWVYDLQHRLNQLGFYWGPQDGIFGPKTLQAVKKFQKAYGIRVDGVVGPVTWRTLYRVTYTEKEIQLMTRLVCAEAGGEPYAGQVAVASVVLNRVKSGKFPNSVRGVIFQPLAFESVQNGLIWRVTPNRLARQAVYDAIRGWDPTHGALFFFNPVKAESTWIWSRKQVARIGNHVFAV